MQRPTLENVRIRSTRDALHVFHGVARNILPLITRRLDADERRAIVAGNVYVWEERNVSTENIGVGMERWTDGMGWGPSRVRDEFLFYHQKESDMEDDPTNPATPLTLLLRKRDAPTRNSRNGSQTEPERLIKQTYSVHVSLPADSSRGIVRKWHLTAYFSQERLDSLNTIDTIRGVGDVPVPEGLFRSARASKIRRDASDMVGPNATIRPAASVSNPAPALHRVPVIHSQTSTHSNMGHPTPSHRPYSLPPNPMALQAMGAPSERLVPLEILQNVSPPRRDPVDEEVLHRLASVGRGQLLGNTSSFSTYRRSSA